MARNTSPLLQLDLKSLTLAEQPTLEEENNHFRGTTGVEIKQFVQTFTVQRERQSSLLALVSNPQEQSLLSRQTETHVEW